MELYNTLSRKIEKVSPFQPQQVTVYTCGPTVYDYPHVGNWFTFIRYDLLVRILKATGMNPKWVMNITDVGHLVSDADEGEDKLEKGAKREGKTAWDIANFYSDYFIEAMRRLNFSKPDFLPKATDHIKEQIELIKQLESKGFTYTTSDGVYYDTSRFKEYYSFAQLELDELQTVARVIPNPEKRNQSDFSLWKFSPKDNQRDMEWDSPWGIGFPGWHIECSAMALKYLGKTIDIHAGGIDHVPIHHTNEIAQSEAATGQRFANIWMHANHILLNDQKMSKSLGNLVTLEDIEQKGYDLEALRLLILESHYRTQSIFSWDALEASQNRLKHWQATVALRWQSIQNTNSMSSNTELSKLTNDSWLSILAAMCSDLNTPRTLRIIDETLNKLEPLLLTASDTKDFILFIQKLDQLFGLQLAKSPDIDTVHKKLISEREEARLSKDWSRADRCRQMLGEYKIGLNDTDKGVRWFWL